MALQDLLGSDHQIPLKITTTVAPVAERRGLNLADQAYTSAFYLVARAARNGTASSDWSRSYTKPREVITFQCQNTLTNNTREFITLQEARDYFGIQSQRSTKFTTTGFRVQGLKRQGLTQKAVAEQMQVSLRTVKRHWNQNHSGGHDSL